MVGTVIDVLRTTVAARDIDVGEELTSDYASFDANHRAP